MPQGIFCAGFTLPDIPQNFTIQHKWYLGGKYLSNAAEVEIPNAPVGFVYNSTDSQYLKTLLADDDLLREVAGYPAGWKTGFRIVFENGNFELAWSISGINETDDPTLIMANLEKACLTAITFHDRMKQIRAIQPVE